MEEVECLMEKWKRKDLLYLIFFSLNKSYFQIVMELYITEVFNENKTT